MNVRAQAEPGRGAQSGRLRGASASSLLLWQRAFGVWASSKAWLSARRSWGDPYRKPGLASLRWCSALSHALRGSCQKALEVHSNANVVTYEMVNNPENHRKR